MAAETVTLEEAMTRAAAEQEIGRYGVALGLLRAILEAAPGNAAAMARIAHIQLQLRRTEDAANMLERALAIAPDLPAVQRNLARLLIARGRAGEAIAPAAKALEAAPADPESQLVLAIAYIASGKDASAASRIDTVLHTLPTYAEAWLQRTSLLMRGGDLAGALRDVKAAAILKPHLAPTWRLIANLFLHFRHQPEAMRALEHAHALEPDTIQDLIILGEVHRQMGAWAKAVTILERAVAQNDAAADAWANLGTAYQQGGDIHRARAAYTKALALAPSMAQIANNLGALAKAEDRWDEALRHFTAAMVSDPSSASFLIHRGVALCALGRGVEAGTVLRKLDTLAAGDKDQSARYSTMVPTVAQSLVNAGRYLDAMPLVIRLLHADRHDKAARNLFVSCARRISWGRYDPAVHFFLAEALTAPWCAPAMLAASGASMVKTHPLVGEFLGEALSAWSEDRCPAPPAPRLLQHLGQDTLFRALLGAGPNTDRELEMVLTVIRRHLLMRAGSGQKFAAFELDLLSIIARQAFTNEFVFWESDEEAAHFAQLKTRIEAEIRSGQPVEPGDILALAAYAPMTEIEGAEAMAGMDWPESAGSVIRQQITEPLQERGLAERIAVLTPIENEVSKEVRAQYEENPYPRWITPVPVGAATPLHDYLKTAFPHAPIRPSPGGDSPEILVAGCGTGQHSLMTSRMYSGARVLAVDLSRRSLGYAIRKSTEAGAEVTYAQADLLQVPALGRHFDAIESVGVLHHLADPFSGWKGLVSILRPGGFMVLGFYSEIARSTLPNAEHLGLTNLSNVTHADIRRTRRALMAGADMQAGSPLQMGDFYATSACRDLLLHVQEHRMTLPGIAEFLAGNGLTFLGFNLASDRLHAYKTQYPSDVACRDLSNWHEFEMRNPSTFLGMYQFWVQKAG